MKIVTACLLLVVSALCEPPVDNRYLPPQTYNSPAQEYGPPGLGGQRQSGAGFRGRPASNYGAPIKYQSPSNQYIPPRSKQNQAPNSLYQAPNSLYQAPNSLYQAPNSLYQAPNSLYQAPSTLNQAPVSQYQAPSSQYGPPSQALGSTGSYVSPARDYGAPGLGKAGNLGGRGAADSRRYLPPSDRGYDDGNNGEPANYKFEYMVLDQESGNDFGHRESRQGERAEGTYYVLLPDGRKQIVEYEADEGGYRPRISYEDYGRAGKGYDRNSGNQYENGPY